MKKCKRTAFEDDFLTMNMECKDPIREEKLVFPRKVCIQMVSTCSTQRVVAHRNTAEDVVPFGHVQRAPYLLSYFHRSL